MQIETQYHRFSVCAVGFVGSEATFSIFVLARFCKGPLRAHLRIIQFMQLTGLACVCTGVLGTVGIIGGDSIPYIVMPVTCGESMTSKPMPSEGALPVRYRGPFSAF